MIALNDVIVALRAALDAAIAAPVYDGPTPTAGTDSSFVLIGDGEPGATFTLDLSSMGNGWDDEAGDIACVAVAQYGSDLSSLRSAAIALVESCRDAVNADPTLGGVLRTGWSARVQGDVDITQGHTSKGGAVRADFSVRYSTLLTS